MQRSKVEIYLHLVWATKGRTPIITPDIERALHRCIASEARNLGCTVLALNGMPDHIHLVVKIPGMLAASDLAKRVKGVSSTFARTDLAADGFFGWQDGYAAFSISPTDIQEVIGYVRNQKRHHSENKLNALWESTGEEFNPETTP
jgi:putative transposase